MPYTLLAMAYLFIIYQSGLRSFLLLALMVPFLMVSFIALHSHADMTLDMDYMSEGSWVVSLKNYTNCFIFSVFVTLPLVLAVSGPIYFISYIFKDLIWQ